MQHHVDFLHGGGSEPGVQLLPVQTLDVDRGERLQLYGTESGFEVEPNDLLVALVDTRADGVSHTVAQDHELGLGDRWRLCAQRQPCSTRRRAALLDAVQLLGTHHESSRLDLDGVPDHLC